VDVKEKVGDLLGRELLNSVQRSCRGKALPQEFINFQVSLIWECFTLNPTTQGQFIDESGEGFTFAN
jgi:hypothetical protein